MAFEKIDDVLSYIQRTLKVPKTRNNTFGNYKYRNAEDIIEAVKEILPEEATLVLSDRVISADGRFYIQSYARISFKGANVEAFGYAREADNQKGMSEAQLTGSASSYARKYALCGLFAIDDGVDDDSHNGKHESVKVSKTPPPKKIETPDALAERLIVAINKMETSEALQNWSNLQVVKDARDRLYIEDANFYQKVEDMINLKIEALK